MPSSPRRPPPSSQPWSMRGGVAPEALERPLLEDYDEVLPARDREALQPGEAVIELRFGRAG